MGLDRSIEGYPTVDVTESTVNRSWEDPERIQHCCLPVVGAINRSEWWQIRQKLQIDRQLPASFYVIEFGQASKWLNNNYNDNISCRHVCNGRACVGRSDHVGLPCCVVLWYAFVPPKRVNHHRTSECRNLKHPDHYKSTTKPQSQTSSSRSRSHCIADTTR